MDGVGAPRPPALGFLNPRATLATREGGRVVARTIPHRELRNNSGAILREVQAGESFEISNHGEVVAWLVPPVERPQRSLRVRKARASGGFSDLPRVKLQAPVQESIDDLRGDR